MAPALLAGAAWQIHGDVAAIGAEWPAGRILSDTIEELSEPYITCVRESRSARARRRHSL